MATSSLFHENDTMKKQCICPADVSGIRDCCCEVPGHAEQSGVDEQALLELRESRARIATSKLEWWRWNLCGFTYIRPGGR